MTSSWLLFLGWVALVGGILFGTRTISKRDSGRGAAGDTNAYIYYVISIAVSPLFFPFTILPYVLFCLYKTGKPTYKNYTYEDNIIRTNAVLFSFFLPSLIAMLCGMALVANLHESASYRIISFVQGTSLIGESVNAYTSYGDKFFAKDLSRDAVLSLLLAPYFNIIPLLLMPQIFFEFPNNLRSIKQKIGSLSKCEDSGYAYIKRAMYVLSIIAVAAVIAKFATYFTPRIPPSRSNFFRYPLDG